MTLDGRLALITGGSRGIGRTIAVDLARRGADVAFTYLRNEEAAQETVALVEAEGRRGVAIRSRIDSAERCAALVDEAAEALGGLDAAGLERRLRRDPPRARGDREALGLDAEHQRARDRLPRPGRRAAHGGPRRRGDHRHVVARLVPRARELHAGRRLEGGPGGGDPVPRRSSSRRSASASTAYPARWSRPARWSTSRTATRCCATARSRRPPAGCWSRRTSRTPSHGWRRRVVDGDRPDADRRRRLLAAGVAQNGSGRRPAPARRPAHACTAGDPPRCISSTCWSGVNRPARTRSIRPRTARPS